MSVGSTGTQIKLTAPHSGAGNLRRRTGLGVRKRCNTKRAQSAHFWVLEREVIKHLAAVSDDFCISCKIVLTAVAPAPILFPS